MTKPSSGPPTCSDCESFAHSRPEALHQRPEHYAPAPDARCAAARCASSRTEDCPRYRAAKSAFTYSRVIRAMLEIGISFGHTASHSPSFEQLPNPSASACSIMATTRRKRSGLPCGSSDRCEIFALMNKWADAFLHAATQAPHWMHAAESIAVSEMSFGIGIALPSGAPPTLTDT